MNAADAARAWSVSEPISRQILAGVRPLSIDKLGALPARVRAAFARAILADAEDDAPASQACPSLHVLHVASVAGELAGEMRAALADSVIDESERRALLRRAGAVATAATGAVLALRRRDP